MGLEFTDLQLEASEHPRCPPLPSENGHYFMVGYEAAADKYRAIIKSFEELKQELEEYKRKDKRIICTQKYFECDINDDNKAVECHKIHDCNICGKYKGK